MKQSLSRRREANITGGVNSLSVILLLLRLSDLATEILQIYQECALHLLETKGLLPNPLSSLSILVVELVWPLNRHHVPIHGAKALTRCSTVLDPVARWSILLAGCGWLCCGSAKDRLGDMPVVRIPFIVQR